MVKEARDPRPYFISGYGGQEQSRNQVGTNCGIESPVAHETLVLEAEIDFHLVQSTCMCPFSLSVYHLEGFIQEKSIPARNQFHGGINYS
jgi:hypothetical protein